MTVNILNINQIVGRNLQTIFSLRTQGKHAILYNASKTGDTKYPDSFWKCFYISRTETVLFYVALLLIAIIVFFTWTTLWQLNVDQSEAIVIAVDPDVEGSVAVWKTCAGRHRRSVTRILSFVWDLSSENAMQKRTSTLCNNSTIGTRAE